MDSSNKIALIYGYLVCLGMIIVALISASMIINAIFDLQRPLKTSNYYGPSSSYDLSSFESYKATRFQTDEKTISSLSETDLMNAYEAAKTDRIDTVRFNATKSLTIASLLLIFGGSLFWGHWRWLKHLRTLA